MWPPAGIALAALWLVGPRLWPGVWLGAAAINYSIALSLPAALAIASGNALEALAGAWLARRYLADKRGPFAEPVSVLRFFAIALGASLIAATCGTATLELIENIRGAALANWLTWWLGDATGMAILCPLVVIFAVGRKSLWTQPRVAEMAALVVLLVGTTAEIFTGWLLGSESPPVTFVLMTFVIWSAIRFGEGPTLALCGLIGLIAIAATVTGRGPFAGRGLNESLLLQQVFVSTLVATGLILAARARKMQRLSDTLRRANVEMEEMMHLAAHDLQEPLRTVINSADLLQFKHGGSLNADALELLGFIVGGAARGQQLIQDLLDVAEAGRRPLAPEIFDSGEALEDALRGLEGPLSAAGAKISRDSLPEVLADRRMLQSVFENLVGNALKYRSSEPPRIDILARRQGRVWIFSVCDNGVGIELRHRELVFRMFERLGPREVPGMGSGLTLCRKIIERHGGRIWIESASVRGTSVHFTLPAGEQSDG